MARRPAILKTPVGPSAAAQQRRVRRLLVGLGFYATVMAVLYLHLVVWPLRYESGQTVPFTIFSPITFDYLDRAKQDELSGHTSLNQMRWLVNPQAEAEALREFDTFLTQVQVVREDRGDVGPPADTDSELAHLAKVYNLDPRLLAAVLDLPDAQFAESMKVARAQLERQMDGEITTALAGEMQRSGLADSFKEPARMYVFFLRPNLVEAPAREPSVDTRQLATVTVAKGNVIVAEGQDVDRSVEDQLDALQQALHEQAYVRWGGIGLVLLLLMMLWNSFLVSAAGIALRVPSTLFQLALLFILALAGGLAIGRMPFPFTYYGVTLVVATLSTLVVLIYDRQFAIYFSIGLAILLSTALTFGSDLLIYTAGGAMLPPVLITPQSGRKSQVWLAFALGLQNTALALVVVLVSSHTLHWQIFPIAMLSGLLAGVLAFGILPIVETLTGQVTPGKLVELASPENRVLRRLRQEAHGTWSHSQNVAELTEEACKAIRANWLLAKVGALYHDIGKLRRPGFFAENIHDDARNPHQGLPPETSARIVKEHVADGLTLAREARLPRDLMQFIAEHHGTYLIRFFYALAERLHESDPENHPAPDEVEFRYNGPIPQSRESGVVMLADITEAVVRSKPEAEAQELSRIIDSIVSDKIAEGQLAASGLTLGDLVSIKSSFINLLAAQRHHRVAYPPSTTQAAAASIHFHSRSATK
jgi:putative nucleotidyltransferase with HDIG domain